MTACATARGERPAEMVAQALEQHAAHADETGGE
jgi:hypothetical protein